jgi:hypothetical protein
MAAWLDSGMPCKLTLGLERVCSTLEALSEALLLQISPVCAQIGVHMWRRQRQLSLHYSWQQLPISYVWLYEYLRRAVESCIVLNHLALHNPIITTAHEIQWGSSLLKSGDFSKG